MDNGTDKPVCELVQLARDRHKLDLQTGADRGLWFDTESADRICDFFNKVCRFTKGRDFMGLPFELQAWQAEDILRPVFGWMKLPGGMTPEQARAIPRERRFEAGIYRRFNVAYIELPRKNGKTELAAGVALFMLIYDGEGGSEVYSNATNFEQAQIVFNAARTMMDYSPQLRKRATALKKSITADNSHSFFKPLPKSAKSMDGWNIHCSIFDELHEWDDQRLYDKLVGAMGSRKQPLRFMITTAGEESESICNRERDFAERILRREDGFVDDSFFAYISTIDKDDDWTDEAVWRKVNPNWDVSVNPEFLRKEAIKAKADPVNAARFRRYYLNKWENAVEGFFDLDKWKQCGATITPEDLEGRELWIGLDWSNRIDLTAAALLFAPREESEGWILKTQFWMPEKSPRVASNSDHVPYAAWIEQGFITPTPGETVDYKSVHKFIFDMAERYNLQKVCVDPWGAQHSCNELVEEFGANRIVTVSQIYSRLSEPFKTMRIWTMDGIIRHDRNPVMSWCVSNTVPRFDPNLNPVPDKKKSNNKIDGVSATVTGMAVALDEYDLQEEVPFIAFL